MLTTMRSPACSRARGQTTDVPVAARHRTEPRRGFVCVISCTTSADRAAESARRGIRPEYRPADSRLRWRMTRPSRRASSMRVSAGCPSNGDAEEVVGLTLVPVGGRIDRRTATGCADRLSGAATSSRICGCGLSTSAGRPPCQFAVSVVGPCTPLTRAQLEPQLQGRRPSTAGHGEQLHAADLRDVNSSR